MKSTQEWSKDHKKSLSLLIASLKAGPELDSEVQDTIQRLDELSQRPGDVHYRGTGLAAEIFPLVSKEEDDLPLWRVTDMACDLYGRIIKQVPRGIAQKLSAPDTVEINYANRDVRMAAQDVTVVAKGLMADPNASIRRKGRSILLAARMLSISAPPPQVFRANECAYCHRHTLMRTACVIHRVHGRYTAAASQRGQFQEALAAQAEALRMHLRSDPALLDGLMSEQKAPRVLVQVCTSLFTQEVSDSVIEAVEIATKKMHSGAGKSAAQDASPSLKGVVEAWHGLPQIDDPEGILAIKQSRYPLASEFLAHLTRYNAYVVSGKEVSKRKRNTLRSPKLLGQMFEMLTKMPQREVAERLDISMTQLRHRMQEAQAAKATKEASGQAKAPGAKKTVKVSKSRSAVAKKVVKEAVKKAAAPVSRPPAKASRKAKRSIGSASDGQNAQTASTTLAAPAVPKKKRTTSVTANKASA